VIIVTSRHDNTTANENNLDRDQRVVHARGLATTCPMQHSDTTARRAADPFYTVSGRL
jgi:hypothetical protein